MELDSNTPSMLYTKYLPEYTTEKYYLISELELFSDLLSINDIIKETDQSNKNNNNTNLCNAVYILWDYQVEPFQSFQSRINQFLTQITNYNINTNNTIISIQILIPTSLKDELSNLTDTNNNTLLSQLYELHNIYNKQHQLIVFGISDNASSTIALEFIYDWFTIIRQTSLTTLIDSTINGSTGTTTTNDNNTGTTTTSIKQGAENKRQIKPKISLNYRLIAPNVYDYLGFHDDEPDADSGAFQLLCSYTTNMNNNTCIQTLINTMLLSILSSYRESPSNLLVGNTTTGTGEGDNKGKLSRNYSIVHTHNNTNSNSNSIYIILFYTISAVVLLLSVLGYLLKFNRLIVW